MKTKAVAADIVSTLARTEDSWIEHEVGACVFRDERLDRRFKQLGGCLAGGTGKSMPLACQDWANTKVAYRFFSNPRVNEEAILAGHFGATQERSAAVVGGPILVLHDTTEFIFKRESLGLLKPARLGQRAWARDHTICGISMHSSLAVTTEGLPLGLTAIKFWTRQHFKGANELKRYINPTRVPIEEKESVRWLKNLQQSTTLLSDPENCVHVADRGGDIYELFSTAQETDTHFLVRTCVDRFCGDGSWTVAEEMETVPVKGLHRVEVRDKRGNSSTAVLELKYRRLRLLPPVAKRKRYPELVLTVIHAIERGEPKGREKIEWKLLTDLPVGSCQEAIEKLDWYAMRWKIEVFHKILKSGCKVEESQLRTAGRLVNLIATFCILSWRIYWMTMTNRLAPAAPPEMALTSEEIALLERLVPEKPSGQARSRKLGHYLTKIAKLGGYLDRNNDHPPGNIVMWRGLSRLADILYGASIYSKNLQKCG